MNRRLSLFVLLLMGLGCAEESSTCEVGGACEAYLLIQCDCCSNTDLIENGSQDLVDQCKQDLTNACGTGRLMVSQSPETCASNLDAVMQYQAAGMDFCPEMEPEQLEQVCFGSIGTQSMSE